MRNIQGKVFNSLVDHLEVERELMEHWCLVQGISYIEHFIDYQQRLVGKKTELEAGGHVLT